MSYITFLASDYPMQEVINPHIHFYSVNEAVDKGIELSSIVLDSTTINRNKPNVILWVENEELLGEITIKSADKSWYRHSFLPEPHLQYYSSLEWQYKDKRAAQLIEYIRKHLENATILEIWDTWIGWDRDESEKAKIISVYVDELSVADLERLFANEFDCIKVKR